MAAKKCETWGQQLTQACAYGYKEMRDLGGAFHISHTGMRTQLWLQSDVFLCYTCARKPCVRLNVCIAATHFCLYLVRTRARCKHALVHVATHFCLYYCTHLCTLQHTSAFTTARTRARCNTLLPLLLHALVHAATHFCLYCRTHSCTLQHTSAFAAARTRALLQHTSAFTATRNRARCNTLLPLLLHALVHAATHFCLYFVRTRAFPVAPACLYNVQQSRVVVLMGG